MYEIFHFIYKITVSYIKSYVKFSLGVTNILNGSQFCQAVSQHFKSPELVAGTISSKEVAKVAERKLSLRIFT